MKHPILSLILFVTISSLTAFCNGFAQATPNWFLATLASLPQIAMVFIISLLLTHWFLDGNK